MAIEVERPSEVTQIPAAPGIKLENLIQFDGDCIDPLALVIITEALDYALETSVRRLKSAGKIFSQVEESAYLKGKGVLPTIKAVRDAFLLAPQCTPRGPRVMPPPPKPEEVAAEVEKKAAAVEKKVTAKPKTEIEAVIETLPKEVQAAAKAEYEKLQAEAKPPVPKAVERALARPKKERELPGFWGKAQFKGEGKEAGLTGEYDSPGALAKVLGIKTRGAKDMTVALERAGFEVRGNGEEVKKEETGFVVKRVKPTPEEWLIPKEKPVEKVEKLKEEPHYLAVKNVKGEVIAWDLIDPKTELAIPEKRVWKGSEEAKELGFE